eukprot:CAMPEP_0114509438 /NCGR_PEP_ID=MMETSP0109-20121206/13212_1 /TAXON_ID=29199 /ORGANISM="Chlorarachnion reptans, Strain CCCM449" /LENGTH=323 /DNA_ID=CAMNT_0001688595 /DNA_START=232 /DNA_END=1203 /DNA_ORIENTATION=+
MLRAQPSAISHSLLFFFSVLLAGAVALSFVVGGRSAPARPVGRPLVGHLQGPFMSTAGGRPCTPGFPSAASARRLLKPSRAQMPEALLFDCDGVLVDTEKDGHRVAFNRAFEKMGLGFEWGVEEYGKLLEVGGGKERMTAYFNQVGWPANWPEDETQRSAKVKEIHLLKTDIFSKMINSGELALRPGVERLVSEAISRGVKVACCSTSNEKSVAAVVDLLPSDKASQFTIFAGDIVPKKKPDPAVYILASEKLGVPPERCAVIEDSHIGKCAGKSAGMTVVVTKSGYTGDEDFSGADAIVDELGDPGNEKVTMDFIANLMPSA